MLISEVKVGMNVTAPPRDEVGVVTEICHDVNFVLVKFPSTCAPYKYSAGALQASESSPAYKAFPKSDARRYFVALLAVDRLKEQATIHYVAQHIGCTRAEARRALVNTEKQFGVVFERDGPRHIITSWGVLKKTALERFLKSGK